MATVGMREVAALAGVSHGSVSHYLNHPDRVSAELAARIQQAIDTLGFVPNIVGRQLRTGSSSAIAYIAPDVSNPYFATIAEGVEQRAAEAGLSVFIANSNRSRAREDAYLELFQQHRVRGMLVASHEGVEDRLAVIRRRGTPTVLVGQAAVSPEQASVSVDDVAGGALAARHLLDGGRRRLAFVGGPVGIRQVGDRLGGAQRAVDAVPGASLEVLPVEDRTIAGGVEAARDLVARAPEDRPDALFAANDLLALGLLQGLVSAGVRVPEEVALVGYDDIEFAAASLIPITSIRSPHEEFGAAAVDLLVAAFDDPVAGGRRVYAPELVVRASSAAVG
ncbi:LacI family DNA-binding transcriptional regulator [Leifsonia naganoensis]|uniref:LacI family transcriptional regulator n=1 Tax=Leifsonia naganoensis TaxID=150025 RepID=A0A853DQB1_9MICO|nr:LacI family DNA-binding transcriptional regulator [Leifsonia naganoensis]NYK11282.1 LacI family transcriptional regulator [Leifsonia naganoensis]